MVDAYFTWLGPPQTENKRVEGVGAARPDLFGLLRTARAQFDANDGPPPNFTLVCLKKYESRFKTEVPTYVNVLALEDAFNTSAFQSIVLTKPDLTNLDLCVDYIIRKTLGVRGTGYADSALPYKMLAFVKDVWSLYCVWKRGGYHIDCGCFPDAKYGGLVKLPEPATFAVPVVSGTGKTPLHCSVAFTKPHGGTRCATVCGGWGGTGAVAQATLGVPLAVKGKSPMDRQVDVWLLRSPAGDPYAEAALTFYIQGWFAMQDTGLAVAQNLRELVVAAVSTAITHTPKAKCGSSSEWKNHLIEAPGGDVASLGLRKVGFQSHA